MSRISIVTLTCDRPLTFALLERWIARQTVDYAEWLIIDSGKTPARPTLPCRHLWEPHPPGVPNFLDAMHKALREVTGDCVVFMEDDDWYAPEHLELCLKGVNDQGLHGCRSIRMFNPVKRLWRERPLGFSVLSHTAVSRDYLDLMKTLIDSSWDGELDRRFWEAVGTCPRGAVTSCSMKGVYSGITASHLGQGLMWRFDPDCHKLKQWTGGDFEPYAALYQSAREPVISYVHQSLLLRHRL